MSYNFPLTLSFKIIAIAPQITVTDSQGNSMLYVRQKLLKFKEAVNVYTDKSQSTDLFSIKADRVIDFSARYNFSSASGQSLGSIKRQGMRSLWKANYEIDRGDENIAFTIEEESAFVRMADGCATQIPILGAFAGYFFNPTYLINDSSGNLVMKLIKQPAFFESSFIIEKVANLDDRDEERIILGLLMMTLLERGRG